MESITLNDFMIWQPNYPEKEESDLFYLGVSNELLKVSQTARLSSRLPFQLMRRIALSLTGYMQDIVSDAGIWRSFVDANRKLYGWSVPFHEITEDYVDYELNREDVRFLVWYQISMGYEELRHIYPHDRDLLDLADKMYAYLDSIYEDAPTPENYNISRGLEFNDPEDSEQIYHLGQWLFLHCYLMTPAYAMRLSEILSDPELKNSDDFALIQNRIEQSLMEDPTGPLAFYIPEWLYFILHGKFLENKNATSEVKIHKYYETFTKATGGETIKFFDSYASMNEFFIESMGWNKGEEHLRSLKDSQYFVLMVDKQNGMLVAKDVARCLAAPQNPYYDKSYAERHAFELLTERGKCPGDLLRVSIEKGWLPDAVFPGSTDSGLVSNNQDFISRCYLQNYYRGD